MSRHRTCARLAAPLVAAVAFAGCMASETRIVVRPDGSGRVTHTMTVSKTAWANFDAMAAAAGDPTALAGGQLLRMTERDAEMIAYALGKNVRLVSTAPVVSGDAEGLTSVYAFDRIEDLRIDFVPPGPGMLAYSIGVEGVGMIPGGRLKTYFDFELTSLEPGKKLLTVRFPDQRLDPSAAPMSTAPRPKNTPEELALLKGFVKGARIELTIEPETRLLRTSSPHREENRVVLMALDIERMALSDDIDKLWGFRPASFDEIRWAVHDLPGATLSIDREVTLEFEAPATPQQPARQGSASELPDTEVFLAPLSAANGKWSVGTPVNISNSPGYDNQPSFTPDGRSVLFTSARTNPAAARAGAPATSQTDIYRYAIASKAIAQVTDTPESEYSPTVAPDGKHISLVRVEADGTQRLWRFTLDGRNPSPVLADVKPVGYHAWIDDRTVALFVLGQPATLQVADLATGRAEVISRSIGRSLQRAPDGSISFVSVEILPDNPAPALTVMKLQRRGGVPGAPFDAVPLVRAISGTVELFPAWTPDGTLLSAHRGTLYGWRPGDAEWTAIANLDALGLSNATRLAVSPAGDWLAVVAQGKSSPR